MPRPSVGTWQLLPTEEQRWKVVDRRGRVVDLLTLANTDCSGRSPFLASLGQAFALNSSIVSQTRPWRERVAEDRLPQPATWMSS